MKIINTLKTERLNNQLWVVLEDFKVDLGETIVSVPKGFVTNGASVPRIFWWLCAPMAGPFGEASVVHDYLYSSFSDCQSRSFADKALYNIGRYRGANLVRAKAVYRAVRLFGQKFWKKSST